MSGNFRFKRDITLITLANFIWPLAYYMYAGFFSIHIRQLGGSSYVVSLISSIPAFLAVIAIPGGILANLMDRKKMVIFFGWAITIPAPLIWAFAEKWEWLLVGQIIYGLTQLSMPAFYLYIFEYKSSHNKMLAFSIVNIGGTFGSVIGPIIGGSIINGYGMRTLYITVFLLYTISTLCLLPISKQRPEKKEPNTPSFLRKNLVGTYSIKKLIIISLFLALIPFTQNISEPYLPIYLTDWKAMSVNQIGVSYAALALGAVIFTWLYASKNGTTYTHIYIVTGLSLFLLSTVLIVYLKHPYSLFFTCFLRGINRALPLFLVGLYTSTLIGEYKGLILSIFITVKSILVGVAAYPGAFLYHLNTTAPFYAEGLLTLLFILVASLGFFRSYWKRQSFENSS